MFHFIESRLQKYADTWWDPYKNKHPDFKHWWDNTRQNATAVCPDDLLGISGFSSVYSAIKDQKVVGSNKVPFGLNRSYLSYATKISNRMAYIWCTAAYGTGAIDATFQEFHHDTHIGTAIIDWLLDTGDAIQHWYNSAENIASNWWEENNHWWRHEIRIVA